MTDTTTPAEPICFPKCNGYPNCWCGKRVATPAQMKRYDPKTEKVLADKIEQANRAWLSRAALDKPQGETK